MLTFLIIIASVGVLSAINMILSENKKRKRANQKLKRFEEEHPRK